MKNFILTIFLLISLNSFGQVFCSKVYDGNYTIGETVPTYWEFSSYHLTEQPFGDTMIYITTYIYVCKCVNAENETIKYFRILDTMVLNGKFYVFDDRLVNGHNEILQEFQLHPVYKKVPEKVEYNIFNPYTWPLYEQFRKNKTILTGWIGIN